MQKAILFIVILFLTSCSKEKKEYQLLQGNAFGTTFNINYDDVLKRDFTKQIDSLIYLVNKSLSTYMPNSDISKINKGDSTIVIDPFFKEVFQKSHRIFKETDGYFDPTVGPLVNAWGFGPEEAIANLSELQIDSLMQFVGFYKVKLINGKIKKEQPEIYFDFNALAKGYGIDIIGRFLESKNCFNYLIELGGEIRARGVNVKGNFWKIAIENPNTDGSRTYEKVVELNNESMATSGNYRKFKIADDGRKFVHTINPITGYAIESDLLSATVISNLDCADVDGYATAFMAMGYERTMTFLEKHSELEVYLIYADQNGDAKIFSNIDLLRTDG